MSSLSDNESDNNSEYESDCAITSYTVFDVDVLNYDEECLSRKLYKSRYTLKRFTYFPRSVKGAYMIRPLYFRGDRTTVVEFPNLTHLEISVIFLLTTNTILWSTPCLRHLTFIIAAFSKETIYDETIVFKSIDEEDEEDENPVRLLKGEDILNLTNRSGSLLQSLIRQYPLLCTI